MESVVSYPELKSALAQLELSNPGFASIIGRTKVIISYWRNGKAPIPQYVATVLILYTSYYRADRRSDADDFSGHAFCQAFGLSWQNILDLPPDATSIEAEAKHAALKRLYDPEEGDPKFASDEIMDRLDLALDVALYPEKYNSRGPLILPDEREEENEDQEGAGMESGDLTAQAAE